ncbi:FAD-dependent oxidoreductase [Patescibacteria group bacterium]|nr:FAD-dependent oxidoreductase [Patescibacteria group bacterium]
MTPQRNTGTVDAVTHLASTFYLARFRMSDPEAFTFRAGQYVIFQLPPPKLRHTMSIASDPKDREHIEILQGVVPGGLGSEWLLHLQPGDPVSFLGPLGKFAVQKESPRKKVFVATGCGIAPFLPMIADYHESGGGARTMLYWGLRHEEDIFWKDEFNRLAASYPAFSHLLTLSRPGEGWTGARGRVTDYVVEREEKPAESEYYLCGNKMMIADIRAELATRKVAADRIFTETFF